MNTDMKHVASCLNNLIGICREGQDELRLAAASVGNSHLRIMLREFSRQRGDLANELQTHVVRLGEQPVVNVPSTNSFHCDWTFMKLAVVPENEPAIIDECQRFDMATLDAYQNVLRSELPPATHALVQRQFFIVRATHHRIHRVERALTSNSSHQSAGRAQ